MLTIALTEKAQSDLEAIYEYYSARFGSKVAQQIVMEIVESMEPLRSFSGLGRPSQHPGVRELMLTKYPYIVPYRVSDHQVQVLRVLHQRTEIA